jgi:trk system potassium uptake protein TrkA
MRVVIIGAGVAGHRLASRLCDEKHDVVVVDHRARPLEEIASELDVQTVLGSGISPGVLEEAGVAKAGLVATVTDRDEVNILAAAFAHAAGARYTVARVSNDELTIERHVENLSALGIDLVVNEHDECAREVLSVLNLGGAKEIVRMAGGRIQAVGTDVLPGSPLLAGPLKDFPHPDVLSNVRLIAVMRRERRTGTRSLRSRTRSTALAGRLTYERSSASSDRIISRFTRSLSPAVETWDGGLPVTWNGLTSRSS